MKIQARGGTPTKTWYFNEADNAILQEMAEELGVSQVDVVRMGIRKLRDFHRRVRPVISWEEDKGNDG